MASNGTVKLVAEIKPSLKAAVVRKCALLKITRKDGVEQSLSAWVGGEGKP